MADRDYVSNTLSWAAGKILKFDLGFIDLFGPNGGRNVIDRILVEVAYAIEPSTNPMSGELATRLFSEYLVADQHQERRRLSGEGLRLAMYRTQGAKGVQEYADLADGDERTGRWEFPLEFDVFNGIGAGEFSIPADLLKRVHLTCGAATALDAGGGTCAIGTTSVTLRAECHEEFGTPDLKAVDMIGEEQMTGNTEHTLHLDSVGAFLEWASAYKSDTSVADGMGDMSGLTEVLLKPKVRPENTEVAVLIDQYKRQQRDTGSGPTNGAAQSNDPHIQATPKAVPLLNTDPGRDGVKLHQMHYLSEVTAKLANTVALPTILYRTVNLQEDRVNDAVMRKYGATTAQVKAGPRGAKSAGFLAKRTK